MTRAHHKYEGLQIGKHFQRKIVNIFLTFVFGAQKDCLVETLLLSTHKICFNREIRNLFFECIKRPEEKLDQACLTLMVFLNFLSKPFLKKCR